MAHFLGWRAAPALSLALVCLLASCSSSETGPIEPSLSTEQSDTRMSVIMPGEVQDFAFAERFPDYAGLWFDSEGDAFEVGVASARMQPEMESGARNMIAARYPVGSSPNVRQRRVQYSFLQLAGWRHAMQKAFQDERVFAIDLDERANAVTFFVSDLSAGSSVKELAASLSVPLSAVRFEQGEPFRPLVQVTDRRRPVENGFQLEFDSGSGDAFCTLGAAATGPGNKKGFVTASHCSSGLMVGNGVNGIDYHQSIIAFLNVNKVADEAIDPSLFSGGFYCPSGKLCRWSDALWADYTSDSHSGGKLIAETTTVGTGSTWGSLTVARYRSAPSTAGVSGGFTVRKTGRTSGTTQGTMTSSCVNAVWTPGSNIIMLCQDVVAAPSAGGDSGAPVYFQTSSDPTAPVYHLGVLWGGNGTQFTFSPWSGIASDLGVIY